MDLKFWEAKPVPQRVPAELAKLIAEVKACPNQRAALETAHSLLSRRYKGKRGQTYLRLPRLFRKPEQVLASPPGFLHCTHMNYVVTVVLVKSGWFKLEDIRLRWTTVFGISPHQYTQVRIDGRWIDVDVWGASYGLPLGDHSHWFHVGRLW